MDLALATQAVVARVEAEMEVPMARAWGILAEADG